MAATDPLSSGDIYTRISKLLDATSDVNNTAPNQKPGHDHEDVFRKSGGLTSIDESSADSRLDYLVYSPESDQSSNSKRSSLSVSRSDSTGSDSSLGSSGMGTPGQQRSVSYSSYLNMPYVPANGTPPLSRTPSPAPVGSMTQFPSLEGLTAAQLSALAPFGFHPMQTLVGYQGNYPDYSAPSPPPTPSYTNDNSPVPSTMSNGHQGPPGFDRRQLPMTPVGPTLAGPLSPIDLGMANLALGYDFAGAPDMGMAPPGFPSANDAGGLPNMNNDLTWSSIGQMYGWDQELIDLERRANERDDAEPVEPTYTWSGQLPPRNYKNPIYSNKVFLGGVPWDVTEVGLQQAFRPFGPVKVEWPGKETSRVQRNPPKGKGYCYLIFESEKSVKSLLANCTHDFSSGGDWYYKISSRRMRCKEVQVIPWVLSDSNFVKSASQKLDPNRTVFVGGLHGMINAEALCQIMKDLFDNVIYAGIDTDKHKYPIGSGRVTFSNHRSFMKAVQAAFIEIRSSKFTKKVQIDPYLEDSMCSTCHVNPGPFFCRDPLCFRYLCHSCWGWHHSIENLRMHKPMTRHSKTAQGTMFV